MLPTWSLGEELQDPIARKVFISLHSPNKNRNVIQVAKRFSRVRRQRAKLPGNLVRVIKVLGA
jgi:hypothetical protein